MATDLKAAHDSGVELVVLAGLALRLGNHRLVVGLVQALLLSTLEEMERVNLYYGVRRP
jgi:hypothetical protein